MVGKSKALESDIHNSLSKEHHLSKLQFRIYKMRIISPIPLNPYRLKEVHCEHGAQQTVAVVIISVIPGLLRISACTLSRSVVFISL